MKASKVLSLAAIGFASALQDSTSIVSPSSSSTTASSPSASATLCGHTYNESGNQYTIKCHGAFHGQAIQIPSSKQRRQSYTYYQPLLAGYTLDRCLNDCDAAPQCVAAGLQDGHCTLYSLVHKVVAAVDGVVGYNVVRFAGYNLPAAKPTTGNLSVSSSASGSTPSSSAVAQESSSLGATSASQLSTSR